MNPSRRSFFKMTAATGMLPLLGACRSDSQGAKKVPFELGIASYTFRKFNVEETLNMTRRLGIKRIAFKSFHLPLESSTEESKQVASQVKAAGINLYGGGVIYMNTGDEVRHAFDYARAAGMEIIIGVPAHDLLKLVEERAKETNIKLAIHNHGPGDDVYPSPQSAYEKIKDMDPRMGLCVDIGHTLRLGIDPSDTIRALQDRVHDIHIKDVSSASQDGSTVEIGRGVIDIPGFLKTLVDVGYSHTIAFEYEKDEDDPLPGLAESVGYVRGVLAAMG